MRGATRPSWLLATESCLVTATPLVGTLGAKRGAQDGAAQEPELGSCVRGDAGDAAGRTGSGCGSAESECQGKCERHLVLVRGPLKVCPALVVKGSGHAYC